MSERKGTGDRETGDFSLRSGGGQSTSALEVLFDEAPDGIVVHDAEGGVLDVNDTLAGMLGYSRAELRSMNVTDFEKGIDEETLRDRWHSMDGDGTEKVAVEGVHQRKDGSTYPVEVWVSKVTTAETRQERFIALARDVTHRKERERELERYKRFVESSSDAMSVVEPDGTITYESPAIRDVLGYEPEELVGENAFEYIHPEDVDEATAVFVHGIEDAPAERHRHEVRFRNAEGEWQWIELRASVELDNPAIEGVLINSSDITERKRAKQALRNERDTFADGPVVVFQWESEDGWPVEYVSRNVEDVFGYTAEQLLSGAVTYTEMIHEDDLERVKREVREHSDADRFSHEPYRVVARDGTVKWVMDHTNVVRNDDGEIRHRLGYLVDITQRREYEQQVIALHGATRAFVDAESRGAVADSAAEAASELLEFSFPTVWFPTDDRTDLELVAHTENVRELLEQAEVSEPSHPRGDWLWDIFESGETVVRSQIPREAFAADIPLRSAIVLPLGEHGVLVCAAEEGSEFRDQEVRLAEMLARNLQVALDQFEQRETLERQRQFTDDLLDALDDVGYVLDTEGDLREWNAALETVSGYTSDEIASMNAADFFAEDDAPTVEQNVRDAFETGHARMELDLLTADGESVPYEFSANVFESPSGERVMAGIGRDRSEHVEYEQQLEEQRDNLEVLNQVVRHDIRNDLQLILLYAELLEEHVGEGGEEYLSMLLESTESAVELTRTARELAEVMVQPDEELGQVSLAMTLEQQVETVQSAYSGAVVTVEGTLPGVHVVGNDMLASVFRNLLKNAILHNDKEVPEVTISTEEQQDHVVVRVADNGPGVPDELKADIFGKGEKGLDSDGTGLGLYLVQSLVDRYGGDVWVEDRASSEGADESAPSGSPDGAVFVVELPIPE